MENKDIKKIDLILSFKRLIINAEYIIEISKTNI